jgi:hypothetical protein
MESPNVGVQGLEPSPLNLFSESLTALYGLRKTMPYEHLFLTRHDASILSNPETHV